MKASRSKALPLLIALLALAIGFAGWSALRKTAGTGVETHAVDSVEAPIDPKTEQAPLAALPEPAEELRAAQPTPVAKSEERVTVATNAELELADAIWVTGRLVYPAGTPIGEEVDVIAKGRAFKTREMHRARVEPNGNFRVAFGPKTRAGLIEIDAPHLFLIEPLSVRFKDDKPTREVLVQPTLGALVIGQLRIPAQGQALATKLVGKKVSWWTHHEDGNRPSTRSSIVDANLHYELRGLDPRGEQTLSFASGVFADASLDKLKVDPGSTRQIDLDLSMGVRLRGRVTLPSTKSPGNIRVLAKSSIPGTEDTELTSLGYGDSGTFVRTAGNLTHAFVESDGSFDVRGITAGLISVRASATQCLPVTLELGALGDGEEREGLALALGLGGQIGGRVRWPDGAPAVGASIELTSTAESDSRPNIYVNLSDPNDIGKVLTDANGEFLISGLERGPFKLLAQAQPREVAAKGKTHAPTWKAQFEDVAIGKCDLELVLLGGYSISGLVIDDTGAPIERFTVSAKPEGAGNWDESKIVTKKFSAKDGRFELAGVPEGAHDLSVNVSRHEEPEALRIHVPAESGPFTFVVARKASIRGYVLLPDGTPAARATLHVVGEIFIGRESSVDGRANAQGEFELSSVSSGSAILHAKLAGYGASEALPLQVAPGQAIEGVRLILRRQARISVEVHASRQGEAISGREIVCYGMYGVDHIVGKSDDKGHSLFENVDPGEWTIMLEPSPEERQSLAQPDASPEEKARLRMELTKQAKVTVEEGGEAHVVFGSNEHATLRITGSVHRRETASPFARVRALATDAPDARNAMYALTDASGRFELVVARAGKYRVEVMPTQNNRLPAGPVVDVPIGGLQGLEIAIPSGRISGRVHAQGNATSGGIQVVLMRGDGDRDGAWSNADRESWPDSSFEFEDLPAGTYSLMANAWLQNSTGQPRKLLEGVKKTIELAEGQDLGDVQVEIEVR